MILWTAFLLGLLGGVHCAGMCGPLMLALPAPERRWRFVLGRLAYHTGRVLTYCLLGLLFGLAGQTLLTGGVQRWLSIGLGILLLAGLIASRRLPLATPVVRAVGRVRQAMGGLLRRRSLAAQGALGVLNGFLPCGLVYVACAGAAATGNVLHGLFYMAAFGLGTWPMMLALSLSGQALPLAWRQKLAGAFPVAVALAAVMLILRGLSLGIPYLSPEFSSTLGGCPHCH